MGLEIDPDYLAKSIVICKVDKPAKSGGTGSGSNG
jgi:hypothetical protein